MDQIHLIHHEQQPVALRRATTGDANSNTSKHISETPKCWWFFFEKSWLAASTPGVMVTILVIVVKTKCPTEAL